MQKKPPPRITATGPAASRARPVRRVTPKKRSIVWWIALAAATLIAGFYLGRESRELEGNSATAATAATPVPLDSCPPDQGSGTVLTNVATSTAGLCPCPRPRPPVSLAIKRKPKPPLTTPPYEGPDPTEATARYLRERAKALGACAPASGGEVRVHLEVTVTPKGNVERVAITNVEPVPIVVSDCVQKTVAALSPPGFDASKPETFAITVVL